ncbi:MAG: hypothetical protein L0G69_08620 [Brevibacterium sp.]|uniref:hypothetical protein n=1 Tax=Brevibacterium sandarakinum TaxID=629680 RepID=UPI00264F842F|nr:hypothetical protein [Brevibacterium sandarakinum]MDN5586615.1 hypothetical protein [Brevibacterium sp.]MDN5657176.1 hypothetical protein [Brevibacterium sandarakinum]
MDAQAHQPGEELADFTENELLSLIDAGTAGAYSEIYRRYIDDAVARASSSLPDADARRVVDDAFLSVLRSLLNGTADTTEGLRSKVNNAIDERLAVRQPRADSSLQGAPASDQDQASARDGGEPDHALLAQAMSTLPDNWQRILWLREVEQLSPEAVADRLNIRTAVVERLSSRAHQDLHKEWDRIRPEGSDAAADRRSALVPAFLTSPIVIERLSDIVAHTAPEPAGSPVADTRPDSTDPGKPDAASEFGQTEADPRAEESDAATMASAAVFANTDADIEPPTSAEGAEPTEDTESGRAASLAAVSASADPSHVPAQTSVAASSRSGFSMSKPVLIPVVAACIGLLGTLVGLAIVPHQEEGLRSGGGTSNVSKVDTSSEDEDSSRDAASGRDEQSPDDTDSHQGSREQGSENSQESVPGSTDQDENEESSKSSRDDAGRTGDDSPSKDDSGDNGDRPSSRNPDDPGPSDSDRPGPESPSDPEPSDPEPSDPESPSDEPSESETPSEPDEPESPSEPAPTTDPEPDPTPTEDDTPPPATDEPESPPETDSPEPDPSDTGTDSEPTPDDPSTGASTSSN